MLKMFIVFIAAMGLTISPALSADIAKCNSVKGYSYFINSGFVLPKDTGWSEDGISKGKTQLTINENGEFDILFVDTTESIVSAKADGAKIVLIDNSEKDISFLLSYPLGTIEIYSFFQEKDGKNKYSIFSLKTQDGTIVPKRGLLVGDCDNINFNLLK